MKIFIGAHGDAPASHVTNLIVQSEAWFSREARVQP